MPPDVALKIEDFTGCAASSLLDKEQIPKFLNGQKYTSKHWEAWQGCVPADIDVKAAEDALGFRIRMMIRASGRGLLCFTHAIARALDDAGELAGISSEALEVECRKEADVTSFTWEISQLRTSLEDAEHSKAEIESSLAGFKDSDLCEVSVETFRVLPCVDKDDKTVPSQKTGEAPLYLRPTEVVIIHRAKLPDGRRIQLQARNSEAAQDASKVPVQSRKQHLKQIREQPRRLPV